MLVSRVIKLFIFNLIFSVLKYLKMSKKTQTYSPKRLVSNAKWQHRMKDDNTRFGCKIESKKSNFRAWESQL